MQNKPLAATLTILLWGILFSLNSARADDAAPSARSLHEEGVLAAVAKDYTKAEQAFSAALRQEPRNPDLLFNLALAHHRQGQVGLAIGLWRRALSIDPDHWQSLQAIEWARRLLKRPDIPRRIEYSELLRRHLLDRTTLGRLLFLNAILLLSAGWLVLGWLGARRRATQSETAGPSPPLIGFALSLALLVSLALSIAKWSDLGTRRATILAEKVTARSDGDPKATELFELFVGLEVVVRREANGWTQVTYPGGPTGWIPADSLFESSKAGSALN